MDIFDNRECRLGEGPHYDERTDRVYWVDILSSLILWRSFDGSDSGSLATSGHVGAAVPRASGGLAACLPEGIVDPWTGEWLARYPAPTDGLRSNDAKADPRGRLWHGTMAYDEAEGRGALYRLDADGRTAGGETDGGETDDGEPDDGEPDDGEPARGQTARGQTARGQTARGETKLMLPGVSISNGLGWSPDGTRMYFIDSPTKRVDVFDFDMESGSLGERRQFAAIGEGFPDGLCVDAEGGVWVAIWMGHRVVRFLPDGSLDRVLELPVPKVTSCAFAGPELDTLIVTTVGPTFAFQLDDVRGTVVDRLGF